MSTPAEDAPQIVEKMHLCLRCRVRKPRRAMDTTVCCVKCQSEQATTNQRNIRNQVLGGAIGSVARDLAQDASFLQKPHVVYAALLERVGGIDGFANMMISDLEEMRKVAGPQRSNKVILDYYKAILSCGIEAQKTAPEAKNLSHMTDDELGAEAIRVAQERYRLVCEEETMKTRALALLAEAADVE